VADVSTEEGRGVLVQEAGTLFGDQLHCLVNNVGFNIRKKAVDYSNDEYRRIMSTNLDSAFALCTALHGMLKKKNMSSTEDGGASSVVNIGSVAGTCIGYLLYLLYV
jgi:Tropinone reductase 1